MSHVETVAQFPWQQTSYIRGNLALGNLREKLLRPITQEGRVHMETALTVYGVVAGAAAHRAAKAEMQRRGLMPTRVALADLRSGKRPPDTPMLSVVDSDGKTYLLGDVLNGYLLPQGGDRKLTSLWPLAAGAAVDLGIDPTQMPPVGPMFAYVTRCMGTAQFGYPEVAPDHRPHMNAREAVKTVWPFAMKVLRTEPPMVVGKSEPPLEEAHWPALTALAAAAFLRRAKGVLDGKIALTILMEAAIAASKVDQS